MSTQTNVTATGLLLFYSVILFLAALRWLFSAASAWDKAQWIYGLTQFILAVVSLGAGSLCLAATGLLP